MSNVVPLRPPATDAERVPPHDLDSERALVGGLLRGDPRCIAAAKDLAAADFYSRAHGTIYATCRELIAEGVEPSVPIVLVRLRDAGRLADAGGAPTITEIAGCAPVPAASQVAEYLRVIADTAAARRALAAMQVATSAIYSGQGLQSATVRGALSTVDEARAASAPTPTVELLDGVALQKPLAPVSWLCEGLKLAPGGMTLVAGNAYSGKSLAMADLAMAVASGGDVYGATRCRRGRAIVLDYDGQGVRISQERIQRIARARDIDLRELGPAIGYARRPGFYLDDPDATDRLCRLLEGVALCVVDSWRGATPATDEWRRGPVQIVGDRLEEVSAKTGCTFVVIDHNVKPPRDGGSARSAMHDVHGSTAKAEVAQSHFAYSGQKGEQTTKVEHVKERITGRELPPFGLRFEDVAGPHGDPRWGLRVVHVDRDEARGPTESPRFIRTLEAVRAGLRLHPGAAGKDALAKLLGLGAPDVRAAVDHLVLTTREVVAQKAARNGVRLYLAEMAPTEEA